MPPKKQRPPKGVAAEAFSHMTAVLENIEQQNKATIEAMFAMERRLTDRFDARFEKIELRLAALEVAVRQNSEDIRRHSEILRKHAEDIVALQRDTARMVGILGGDRDVNAITALENRVAALEARVGLTTGH